MTPPSGFAICRALKGRWRARQGMCRCPAHQDGSPSLSVTETRDGRVLVHCHAGCSQESVISALRGLNLWPDGPLAEDPQAPGRLTTLPDGNDDRDERERMHRAREIWHNARPIGGTLAETYLRSRRITIHLPPTLRFHPALDHTPSRTVWPALIAALQDGDGKVIAVQRTYLARDGQGKAPVTPAKLTLGPMRDAAVRLGDYRDRPMIGIAEGIETALSARQMFSVPVWATLSANRLARLRLPPLETLVIFADTGEVGIREAFAAADHYEQQGLKCLVQPPEQEFGDWNDALTGKRKVVVA